MYLKKGKKMKFKELDYDEKKFYILGALPILIKIILLVFVPGYSELVTIVDLAINTVTFFVLALFLKDEYESLGCVYMIMATFELLLSALLSIVISAFGAPVEETFYILIMAVKISILNVAFGVIIGACYIFSGIGEELFGSLKKRKKDKEKDRIRKIVEVKAGPHLMKLKEACSALDKIEESLENVPYMFAGKNRRLVRKTISLIGDIADSYIIPLDIENLTRTAGLDKSYSSYFEKAFNDEGFKPYYVKEWVSFRNIVEYWKSYIKIVENLEDKTGKNNTRLLKDLYEETKGLFKKILETEEKEKKRELKLMVKEAVNELKG